MRLTPSNTTAVNSEMAQAILENGVKNRPLTKSKVNEYKTAMESGKFGVSEIVFNSNDELVSGFHRMTALSELSPDIWVNFTVVYDDDPLARIWHNAGKVGTAADEARRNDLPHAKTRVSIARQALIVEKRLEGTANYRPSNVDIYEYAKDEPLMPEALNFFNQLNAIFGVPAALLASYVILAKVAPDLANDYFSKLATGAGLEVGSPILAARNGLSKAPNKMAGNSRVYLCTYFVLRGFEQWLLEKVGPTSYTTPGKFGAPEEEAAYKRIMKQLAIMG